MLVSPLPALDGEAIEPAAVLAGDVTLSGPVVPTNVAPEPGIALVVPVPIMPGDPVSPCDDDGATDWVDGELVGANEGGGLGVDGIGVVNVGPVLLTVVADIEAEVETQGEV